MKEFNYLEELIQEYPSLSVCKEDIKQAFLLLLASYSQGGKVLVCGNGGSGADAEHIVGELMKEFYIRRPLKAEMRNKLAAYGDDGLLLGEHLQEALTAITLTSNIALSTAYANDAKPELVFAQQVYGYGRSGDVLLGISASGNAKNVLYAMETAKAIGLQTVGLTGRTGGALKQVSDVCICAPQEVTYKIQEFHLPIYHTLCRMLEEVFFG